MAKDKDYKRMIHTSRWLKLRRDKLSDYPLCERCEQMGKVTAATEVHHVHPVEMGLTRQDKERLMYDYFNLRSLCHDCHVQTHVEMGRCGKVQAKTRQRCSCRNLQRGSSADQQTESGAMFLMG